MTGEGLRFGRFWFDVRAVPAVARGELPYASAAGRVDILAVLVAARGEVVGEEELMARVWPGQVVEERNLQVQVSTLRKALDDAAGGQSHLVTVPGRGYRLVGLVETPAHDRYRPSIGVLPLQNLSNDPVQEHFADGIVEDI